jgi:hypothetical protein
VRLRLQWLDGRGKRVRIALQSKPDQDWTHEEVSDRGLVRYMKRADIEDPRDWGELGQQAQAARREWGHEGGFAEWSPLAGTRRFSGDMLRTASD